MSTTQMASAQVEAEPVLGPHLVRLPGTEWALWRWVAVRGTGFPIAEVGKLAAPECGRAAAELLCAEDEVAQATGEALDALRQELAKSEAITRAERRKAVKELLNNGRVQTPGGACDAAMDRLEIARSKVAALASKYEDSYASATARISLALEAVAGSDRFCEAVIWQNRKAYHTALKRLPSVTDRERRSLERLVASYLQRFCTKNDTIGFFGPVGWARIAPRSEAFSVRPGPGLLAARNVYYETWCMNAMAEALASDERLRPWLAPQRMPFIRVVGNRVHVSSSGSIAVTQVQASLLLHCDGKRTAKQIARDFIGNRAFSIGDEKEIYRLLQEFHEKGLISWTLDVPIAQHPERALASMLERIDDESLRATCLDKLLELESARLLVAKAAGRAEELDAALQGLEETFSLLTGVGAVRLAGKTYAGRTLVYEDCRRDIDIEIGPEMIRSLAAPLSLLLQSARWLTYQAATNCRESLRAIYADLARRVAARPIDFLSFSTRAQMLLFGERERLAKILLPTFQKRWRDILAIGEGQTIASYDSELLWPKVVDAFAAPESGWKSARYQSPDIMIVASSVEAIRANDFQFVMGELHVGLNTLGCQVFMAQHPAPGELLNALAADLPEPRLVPVISKAFLKDNSSRVLPTIVTPGDFRLLFAPESTDAAAAKVLPVGEMIVEESGDGLVVRTRDGRHCFDILEVFAYSLANQLANCFKILGQSSHTPRVVFDRLVVCRESWSFPAYDLRFAWEKTGGRTFLKACDWASANGLPRFVFVRTPIELKPFYVDMQSPILVDILAKSVRRLAQTAREDSVITITEMLPGPDQVWLPDSQGQLYTCEMRAVALDLKTTDGAGRR